MVGLRIAAERLTAHAAAVLSAAGMSHESARVTAHFLALADMSGYQTHGVALVDRYVGSLEDGSMNGAAEPVEISRSTGTVVLDGQMGPGLSSLWRAIGIAKHHARQSGNCALVMRNAHHVGALGVFLPEITSDGLMGIIASSSPGVRAVAPYGGKSPVLSPNPIAVGIPTSTEPICIDTSTSITTLGEARRTARNGGRLPGPWAIGPNGEATDNAKILFDEPPGALLPAGGTDHGHKGFALALLVEMLTQGLSGLGRRDAPSGWTNSIFLQIFDPAHFSGTRAFLDQADHLVELCTQSDPIDPQRPVRMPGSRARDGREKALGLGVPVARTTLDALDRLADRFGLPRLS